MDKNRNLEHCHVLESTDDTKVVGDPLTGVVRHLEGYADLTNKADDSKNSKRKTDYGVDPTTM